MLLLMLDVFFCLIFVALFASSSALSLLRLICRRRIHTNGVRKPVFANCGDSCLCLEHKTKHLVDSVRYCPCLDTMLILTAIVVTKGCVGGGGLKSPPCRKEKMHTL